MSNRCPEPGCTKKYGHISMSPCNLGPPEPTTVDGWDDWLDTACEHDPQWSRAYCDECRRHALESVEQQRDEFWTRQEMVVADKCWEHEQGAISATLDRVLEVVPDVCGSQVFNLDPRQSICNNRGHYGSCPKAIRAKVEEMKR